MKDVTFKPFENTTCAELPVVDDTTQESPETFSLAFGSTQDLPGIQTGILASSLVTIIDDETGPGISQHTMQVKSLESIAHFQYSLIATNLSISLKI